MKAGRGELTKRELDVLKGEIDDSHNIFSCGQGKDAFQFALNKAEKTFEGKNNKLALVFTGIAAIAAIATLSDGGMPNEVVFLIALVLIASYIGIEKFNHYGDTEEFFDWLNDRLG